MASKTLQCMLVTPEKQVLSVEASMVVVPAFDGEVAFLPGHAATIARLGAGELRIVTSTEKHSYFIQGGFAQCRSDVISILTPAAKRVSELSKGDLERELQDLTAAKADSPEAVRTRTEKISQVKASLRLVNRGRAIAGH